MAPFFYAYFSPLPPGEGGVRDYHHARSQWRVSHPLPEGEEMDSYQTL